MIRYLEEKNVDVVSGWRKHRKDSLMKKFISRGLIFSDTSLCTMESTVLFFRGAKMSNNIFPPLLTIFFMIIGLLMLVFGLMSEILIKTYYGTGVESSYSIKEVKEYN